MKKIIFTAALMVMTTFCLAQSKNIVPEYIGQVAILNPDSTITVLTKETGGAKTKSTNWGMIPIPGSGVFDKTKSKLIVKGKESPTKVSGKLVLIMRAETNDKEPSSVFGIFKFDVKKKERFLTLASAGVLTGIESMQSLNTVPSDVKKYGSDCYIINLGKLESGEYGIFTGDISSIATFSVN